MNNNTEFFVVDDEMESAVRFLKSVAHPSRLQILIHLREGEASVHELEQAVGISQSNMSQHLGQMKRAGVLKSRRDGSQVFYSLMDEQVLELLMSLLERSEDEGEGAKVPATEGMGMPSENPLRS